MIRPATSHDLPAIMAMETSVFGAAAWSTEAMSRDVSDRNCVYIVAETLPENTLAAAENPTVIAFAGLLCPPGSGEGDIQTIAVAPEARGWGLGRALMVVLLDRAAERLAERVFLEVRADNDVAIALYASLGFEEIAVRPQYYQPEGIDALIMRRDSTIPQRQGSSVGSEVLS